MRMCPAMYGLYGSHFLHPFSSPLEPNHISRGGRLSPTYFTANSSNNTNYNGKRQHTMHMEIVTS